MTIGSTLSSFTRQLKSVTRDCSGMLLPGKAAGNSAWNRYRRLGKPLILRPHFKVSVANGKFFGL
jgi:hypothetical protein